MRKKLTIEEAGDKVVLTYWTIKERTCPEIIARIFVNATDDFLYDAISAADDLATKIARDGFYTGRVVCIERYITNFTVGKIYEWKNGYTVDDNGNMFPSHPVLDLEDVSTSLVKFLPLVE